MFEWHILLTMILQAKNSQPVTSFRAASYYIKSDVDLFKKEPYVPTKMHWFTKKVGVSTPGTLPLDPAVAVTFVWLFFY